MPSPVKTYVGGIHRKFDFYAAWPPQQARRLGDVGILKDAQFQRTTSLADLGIKFKERVGSVGEDLSYTSGSNVSLQLKARGQTIPGAAIPEAKAGALVAFSAAGAFVFQAAAPAVREIENQAKLAEDILDLYRRKKNGKRLWREEWCVITELLTAEKVTVLVSASKASKVELSAEGQIPVGATPLASASGGLSVVSQTGEVTSVLAAANLTPMFRVQRVRRSVLDALLGGDDSADLGRAGVKRAASAPKRALEPVPVKDGLGNITRAWKPAVPKKPKPKKKAGVRTTDRPRKTKTGKAEPRG